MTANDVRADFPFFANSENCVYLDSAATTQKPQTVIDALTEFYNKYNANVSRGEYPLADAATRAYGEARRKVGRWFGADEKNVAFTYNATDALNAAAQMLGDRVKRGKNVVVSPLEHHSALLPWMKICKESGAELRFVPLAADGSVDLNALEKLTDENTCAAVMTAGSNVSGYRAPLEKICGFFADKNVPLVIDAAQAAAHEKTDASKLKFEYMCLSAHKTYGPMGLGVLISGNDAARERAFRLGGGTVDEVTADGFTLRSAPESLEAGTPNVAGAVAFGAAIDYLSSLDVDALWKNECELADALRCELEKMNIRVAPCGKDPLPVVSFAADFMHPLDMARLLGSFGFCVRSGRHCAHTATNALGFDSTVRVSLGIYNTREEINDLIEKIKFLKGKYGKL